jgi:hypothetical protein
VEIEGVVELEVLVEVRAIVIVIAMIRDIVLIVVCEAVVEVCEENPEEEGVVQRFVGMELAEVCEFSLIRLVHQLSVVA